MTREEAIEVLQITCEQDTDLIEALDMATTKALSEEPCEDAISMSVVEDIKTEIGEYRDNFILANRHDLASVAENCLMFIDKHISRKESE